MTKRFLMILVLGLLLSSKVYAEIRQLEQTRQTYRNSDYSSGRIVINCIDGYKFVTVRAHYSVSITQAFEEKDGRSVPSKC